MSRIYILIFYLLGIFLIYLEFYLPGGVLGLLGWLSLLGSVVLGFKHFGTVGGTAILGGEVLTGIFLIWLGFKMMPRTPIGKQIILSSRLTSTHTIKELSGLIGKQGHALTSLRPAGKAEIDGVKYDVLSEGFFIDEGEKIQVVKVEGGKIFVRSIHGDNQ